jgi:hypothetical protein
MLLRIRILLLIRILLRIRHDFKLIPHQNNISKLSIRTLKQIQCGHLHDQKLLKINKTLIPIVLLPYGRNRTHVSEARWIVRLDNAETDLDNQVNGFHLPHHCSSSNDLVLEVSNKKNNYNY